MFEHVSNLTKWQKRLYFFFFLTVFSDITIRLFNIDSLTAKIILETAFVLCILGFSFGIFAKRRNSSK